MTNKLAAQFSEEELEGLTDEERAGLLDDSLIDAENGPDDGAEADAAATEEVLPDAEAAVVAVPDATAEAVVTEPTAEAAAAQVDDAALAVPVVDVNRPRAFKAPENVDQQITALQQQQDELDKRFDEGDLSATERRQQDRELDRQISDLRRQQDRASQSLADQQDHWFQSTVAQFLAQPGHAIYKPDSVLTNALDHEVRLLQSTKFKDDPFDPAILAEAHAKIVKDLGIVVPTHEKKRTAPAADGQRQIPPTIGTLPTAGADDLSGDGTVFARLDKLANSNGIAYEQELEKLSPEMRDRYLANN